MHRIEETDANRHELDARLKEFFSPFKVPANMSKEERTLVVSMAHSTGLSPKGHKILVAIFKTKNADSRHKKFLDFVEVFYQDLEQRWQILEAMQR